ncbi:MAG: helix-turn-helix domain-containing protein [Gemmataceae bacterium]|nr:helix-turn-helix domain-containing protein [Gemmataceae bacterium]
MLKPDQAEGRSAWSGSEIAKAYGISLSTVHRTREAFVHEGLDAALHRKKPTGRQYRMLDGEQGSQTRGHRLQPGTCRGQLVESSYQRRHGFAHRSPRSSSASISSKIS